MSQQYESNAKYVGTLLPLPLHHELRKIAVVEGLSLSGLLRETLIEKLELQKVKERRRRGK